jgi:hypothetical protein
MRVPAFVPSRPIGLPQARVAVFLAMVGLVAAGCTSQAVGVAPSRAPLTEQGAGLTEEGTGSPAAIAAIHRRKCGNCHTRIEPGSLPRATIESAMARHRRRAKLTDGQWAELIEFLSRSGPAEPHHTASLP